MGAAVITATMVQKRDIAANVISGTAERRLAEIYLEGPKATQNDWFLLSTYLSTADTANIFSIYACVDGESGSANIPELDTFTYTSADAKVVLSGSTTGKARVSVKYWTE